MERSGKENHGGIVYTEKKIERQLPKNIRQIGEITGKRKIYIEDYVVTYLNQLAHPTNAVARGAILVGEWVRCNAEEVLFISGAVEADNLSFDINEIKFSGETWSALHDKIGQYFENSSVVGWFLSRLGYSVNLTDSMLRLHREHFKEEGSVLYLMDALEQEDAFYLYSGGQMARQSGYYIYYERNTPMQNYLIDNQGMPRQSQEDKRIEYKDGQLLHSYHEIMAGRRERKEEKRITGMLYVTSALLIIVFLALSISIFNNYDKLHAMQVSLDHMITGGTDGTTGAAYAVTTQEQQETVGQQEMADNAEADGTAAVENGAGDTTGTEDAVNSSAEGQPQETTAQTADQDTAVTAGDSTQATDTASASPVQNEDAVQAASVGNQNYYTVQPGDTLLSISQQIYHSDAYVETLRAANEIGEDDYIYPGQQIVIPTIQ